MGRAGSGEGRERWQGVPDEDVGRLGAPPELDGVGGTRRGETGALTDASVGNTVSVRKESALNREVFTLPDGYEQLALVARSSVYCDSLTVAVALTIRVGIRFPNIRGQTCVESLGMA